MTEINKDPGVTVELVTSIAGQDLPEGQQKIVTPPFPPQVSNLVGFGYSSAQGTSFYRMDTNPWSLVSPLSGYTPQNTFSIAFSPRAQQLILGFDTDAGFDVYSTSFYPFQLIAHVDGPQLGDRTIDVEFDRDGERVAISWSGESSPRASIYSTTDYSTPLWETEVGRGVQARWNFNSTRLLVIGELFVSPYLRLYDTLSESLVSLPSGLPSDDFEFIDFHPSANIFAGIQGGMVLWLGDLVSGTMIGSRALEGGSGNVASGLRWNYAGDKLLYGRSGSGEQTAVLDMSDLNTPASWLPLTLSPTVTGGGASEALAWSTDDEYFTTSDDVEVVADDVRAYNGLVSPFTAITSFNTVAAVPRGATFLSNILLP